MKFIKVPGPQAEAALYNFSNTSLIVLVLIYLVSVSLIAFALFGIDKYKSVKGYWRTSESSLLFWAFIGGALGAKIAQRVFRHKTRKEPFRSTLNAISYWNVLLYIGATVYLYTQP